MLDSMQAWKFCSWRYTARFLTGGVDREATLLVEGDIVR
jgi:hypothetical protein